MGVKKQTPALSPFIAVFFCSDIGHIWLYCHLSAVDVTPVKTNNSTLGQKLEILSNSKDPDKSKYNM